MKFYAAALLALSAAAIKVADLDAEIDKMMETPPTCPPEPSQADQDAAEDNPEAVFDLIDQDGSGKIDAREGFEALYCAASYGWISEEDARGVFKYLAKFAGDDEELSKDEAKAAFEALPSEAE